jgi:hypothetical protein
MIFTGVFSFWIDVVKMRAIRKIENGIKAEIGRVKRRVDIESVNRNKAKYLQKEN